MYFVSQPIVTNGLILNMDAGNTLSYTSGSSTWRDLSGNNITGSLVNNPTFNTGNGGSLTFNGLNNYVTFGNEQTLQFSSSFSAFTWFKRTDPLSSNYQSMVGNAQYQAGGWFIGILTGYPYDKLIVTLNTASATSALTSVTELLVDKWYYGGFTLDSGNLKLYLNGINEATTAGATIAKGTNTFSVGQGGQGGWYPISGSVASTQVYNRALTQSEVTQNFNALKGRYGL